MGNNFIPLCGHILVRTALTLKIFMNTPVYGCTWYMFGKYQLDFN